MIACWICERAWELYLIVSQVVFWCNLGVEG